MKMVSRIAQILLGLIFLVFGLNGFLHFIPQSPPPGVAGQFLGALFVSHYLVFVFCLQLISAVLFLINRFVPLALVLIGPVIVNILYFHVSMDPKGIPLALLTAILWIIVAIQHARYLSGIFVAKAE